MRLPGSTTDAAQARSSGRPDGFTLLEILVALAVLGMIMGAVYGSYRAVTNSIAGLAPRARFELRGRFFVQRLSRQLRCCYGGRSDRRGKATSQDADRAVDVVGRAQLFRGGRTLGDGSMLSFVTTGVTANQEYECGQLKSVFYKCDSAQRTLLTCEDPYGQLCEDRDRNWYVILENVSKMELKYFDGTEWHDEWDSTVSKRLPRAVCVELILESQEGYTFSPQWTICISCYSPAGGMDTVDAALRQTSDPSDS